LLAVIASPVIINTFEYPSRTTDKLIIFNKESYCAREYPTKDVKALTPSEFDAFVAKEVATISTTQTYNFFMVWDYRHLSDLEAMKRWHKSKLTDRHYNEAVYRGGERCERPGGRSYAGDVIPWYYF
jgi:hypothetical protein